MIKVCLLIAAAVLFANSLAACGVVYDASAKARTMHMADSLKAGESTLKVHDDWGEPDLRTPVDGQTEVWSYVSTPNSNDVAASLLYTSTKPGDNGKFLDLKFVDSKLVSWNTVEHTMPGRKGTGFSYGLGGIATPVKHY
jgi:hypothetical protein